MSNQYFGSSLGKKIHLNYAGEIPILNNEFLKWKDQIILNLERTQNTKNEYDSDEENELLLECRKHAEQFRKPIESENVLILVHPLYLHLSHMNKVNHQSEKEANEYLEKLMKLLTQKIPKKKLNIVLVETLYHYAAASNILVKEGLVDKVVFSQYDEGYPVTETELSELKNKNIYLGGGYAGYCLNDTISTLYRICKKKLWAVSDLVLKSPISHSSIKVKPSEKIDVYMSKSKTISLDDFVNKIMKP